MDLGKRIQKLRKEAKLSQTDLAKAIAISYTQMSRYEIKGVQPPADVLKRLAALFGVSVDYLVNGSLEQKATNYLDDNELLQQFKAVEKMNNEDKNIIKALINAFIIKHKMEKLIQ